MDRPDLGRVAPDLVAGLFGGLVGSLASLFALFGPAITVETGSADGTAAGGTASGIDFLLGDPNVGAELFFWPVVLLVVSLAGAYGVSVRYNPAAWVATGATASFAVFGPPSIAALYTPAAIFFVAAAVLGFGEDRLPAERPR